MNRKNTHTDKEIVIQTPPNRGRLARAAEAKERRGAAAGEIPPALVELRAQVRRALKQLEAAIKKYRGGAEP